MANAFLQSTAISAFKKGRSLLNVFNTNIVGVDADIVAQGDELVYTFLDKSQVGKGEGVDGKVTVHGRPARTQARLKLDYESVIAYQINKDDSEVSKTSVEQLEAEVENKLDGLETQVYSAIVAAATDPINKVIDASTDANMIRAFSDLETQLVLANVPKSERVCVTSPVITGRLQLARAITKLDSFVEMDNYAGHFGTMAVFYDNKIVADLDGTYPVIYGAKTAVATGVLIDDLQAKDGTNAVGFYKAAQIVEGAFVGGWKVLRPELYMTNLSLEAVVS